MQSNGHTNGQTSNQNYERPSPQSWYKPLSRPMVNQNASLLNNKAMQIGGFGPTQENGMRMFPNPMFEAIPGTRGFTNPLFKFVPRGLEGFSVARRETTHVPPITTPFADHFIGQA